MDKTNVFNTVEMTKPRWSIFDLSYDHKLSLKMGELVPVGIQEVLPSDKFTVKSQAMFRMMPMLAPIMHKVDVTMHHWFVPTRILWDNWEQFITGGQDGSNPPPALPVLAIQPPSSLVVNPSSLANYLGLPVNTAGYQSTDISALPFAAYQKVWYDNYRDQNMQDIPWIDLKDGEQDQVGAMAFLTTMRRRAWEHDYFTSCLPFAQKGQPVELPIDFTQDLVVQLLAPDGSRPVQLVTDSNTLAPDGDLVSTGAGAGRLGLDDGSTIQNLSINPNGSLYVDSQSLSTTTTINDLRASFALQQWLEKNMRAGSRYKEALQAHFGVISSDGRLQRPQYLGGCKSPVSISEVLQTSETDGTAQGNMAGHGISISDGRDFTFRSEEHGFIVTVLTVKPRTAYYQGIPKLFFKTDRYAYAFPDFAQLGEQPVLNKELYWNNANQSLNDQIFGYLPIYSDYRYNASRVSGQMATTLEYWHMARKFANTPTLSESFIVSDPTTRIFAVDDPTEDQIVAHIYHMISAKRPLPRYGTPGGLI